jgi:hypothetical protein
VIKGRTLYPAWRWAGMHRPTGGAGRVVRLPVAAVVQQSKEHSRAPAVTHLSALFFNLQPEICACTRGRRPSPNGPLKPATSFSCSFNSRTPPHTQTLILSSVHSSQRSATAEGTKFAGAAERRLWPSHHPKRHTSSEPEDHRNVDAAHARTSSSPPQRHAR